MPTYPAKMALDSVIRLEEDMLPLVRRLDHALVQFHDKFWGKNLDQYQKPLPDLETFDCREDSEQRQGGVVPATSSVLPPIVVNDKKGKALEGSVEGTGQTPSQATTEDDEDEAMVEDWRELDDVIPGTSVFNLGIPRLTRRFPHILIRADYIRMFEAVSNYLSTPRVTARAKVAIVTGQPGIGKTIWNFYAIARCLSRCQPIIWLFKGEYFLFVEDGVYGLPRDFQRAEFPEVIWTFVDSDGNKEGIPAHLTVHFAENLFVIYTTSPNRQRWSHVHNVASLKVFVMNPWTRKEIHQATTLLTPKPDFGLIDDLYDRLGPTPRICIDKVDNNELLEYEEDIRQALRAQSIKTLEALTTGAQQLSLDSLSHKLCLIRRTNHDFSAVRIFVEPITGHVGSRLALHLQNAHVQEQLKLYKTYAMTPTFRGMSGTLFKGYCHGLFQDRIMVQLHQMVRREGDSKKYKPQLHTVYSTLLDKELEKLRQDTLGRPICIDIRPSAAYEYRDTELKGLQIQEDVYYVPFKGNEVALDPFILSGGYLHVLQMSGARHHGEELLSLLHQCDNAPTHDCWRFIFVVPNDGQVLKIPYTQIAEVWNLTLFSVMMKMDTDEIQKAKEKKPAQTSKRKQMGSENGDRWKGLARKKRK